MQLLNAKYLTEDVKKELCDILPFFDEHITFATKIYDENYRVIIISVVDDYIRGIYRHKQKGYYISFSGYWECEQKIKNTYDITVQKYIENNFDFLGKESLNMFKGNLEKIINLIGPERQIILINGIDLDVSDWIGEDRCKRNHDMNQVVDEVVKKYSNVHLLDMRLIVTDRSQLPKQDNRHFVRKCYYDMAQEIVKICNNFGNLSFKMFISQ